MKKQFTISDIDFTDLDNDLVSPKNVIKNLLGNYFFSSDKNFKYSWYLNPKNTIDDSKKSLIIQEKEIQIVSANVLDEKEVYEIKFEMLPWNEEFKGQYTSPAAKNKIQKLLENINNELGKCYYYGVTNSKNSVEENDPDKVIKEYGEYFYDYNMSIPLPILPRTDGISSKELEESPTANQIAVIDLLYNYFDKNYENISKDTNEEQIYNFYLLYYYLLENIKDSSKQKFLIEKVLPNLKKYENFVDDLLDKKIIKEQTILKELKNVPADASFSQLGTIILPDAVKTINEINDSKSEQPFGIDIQIPSQPVLTINAAIGSTNSSLPLQKAILVSNLFDSVGNKACGVKTLYKNDNTSENTKAQEIKFYPLNDWLKNLFDEQLSANDDQTIAVFSKDEANNESVFIQKIKKILLQKKVNSIINSKKRTFLDLLTGEPAYSEVMFFEIRKFDSTNLETPIQKIVFPNTNEVDFYKYFDTQVKYDKEYTYDVLAWTLIIGNKYKYFDRVAPPPPAKIYDKVKNNSSKEVQNNIKIGESEQFTWFRIADSISEFPYEEKTGLVEFLNSYPNLFSGFKEFKGALKIIKTPTNNPDFPFSEQIIEENVLNFSNLLFENYNSPNSKNNLRYKVISNAGNINAPSLAIQSYEIANENFSSLFSNLVYYSKDEKENKFTFGYQTYDTAAGSNKAPLDIKETKQINKSDNKYYVVTEQLTERKQVYKILQVFKDVGLLSPSFQIFKIEEILQNHFKELFDAGLSGATDEFKEPFVKKVISQINKYISQNFLVQIGNLQDLQEVSKEEILKIILDGGFYSKFQQVDLKQQPNYGLEIDKSLIPVEGIYHPRFETIITSKFIKGFFDFGVLNYTDIILAGLPYMDKTNIKAFSSPPAPPDVLPIPYKNIANKVKFFLTDSYFTYRDYPIVIDETIDKAVYSYLLENEKYKNNDGKITFRGDEVSQGFAIYRLEEKPETYTDFSKARITAVNILDGGFEDQIQPNKKYYYVFRAVDGHNLPSNPSPIYEIEMVENSGAIYPIIKLFSFDEKEGRTLIKSFKETLKIILNQEHLLPNKQVNNVLDLGSADFGKLTPSVFGRKFKIRVTSKSSKKKIDINLVFDKNIDQSSIQDYKNQQKQKSQQQIKKV